jgi:hypothetical protein
LSDEEWMYDTDDDDEDDDFIIEGGKKKKIEKKTTPLQCSYRQFLDLLQELNHFMHGTDMVILHSITIQNKKG